MDIPEIAGGVRQSDGAGAGDNGSAYHALPMWKNAISFLLILVPLLGGFFLSPSVLDAQMAAKKTGLPLSAKDSSQANRQPPSALQPEEPEAKPESDGGVTEGEKYGETMQGSLSDVYRERIEKMQALPVIDVTDENFVAMSEVLNLFPEKFKGKTIRLKGFVYKDPMLQNGQIVVARFIITHCVADAGIIGYVSQLGSADRLKPNDWIEVTGKLNLIRLQDVDLPMIEVKRWKKIDPPKDPYVYP